jgi:hypothetical protein
MTAITLQLLTTNKSTRNSTTQSNPTKQATLKVPDRATRTSMVMLAKKWASLTGVPSTTVPVDINCFKVVVPDAECVVLVEVDRTLPQYNDQLIQKENKNYVWYEREYPALSYGTKGGKRETLKGVWR